MTDGLTLRYKSRNIIVEKCSDLIAVRARAGMAAAMQSHIQAIAPAAPAGQRPMIGSFEIVSLPRLTARVEARPRLAARPVFRLRQRAMFFG